MDPRPDGYKVRFTNPVYINRSRSKTITSKNENKTFSFNKCNTF